MTTLRRIFIATAITAAAASFASADTIGCGSSLFLATSDSTECFQASVPDTAINWGPNSLSISQFNTALGTLNYVEIIAWASGNASLNVQNTNSTTSESFTAGFAHISESFSGTGFTTITLSGGLDNQSGTVSPGGQDNIPSSPFSANSGASGGQIISLSALLGAFKGTGTIGSLSASGGPSAASGSGDPALFYNANGDVGGTIAILYDYTPPPSGIPEPATMALMGGALLGLGTVGKRFLKKS